MKTSEKVREYQHFVSIRQNAFYNHMQNSNYIDTFLGDNKFTNIYRITDRTSQFELRNVIYHPKLIPDSIEVLKRIFLFNQFKTQIFWDIYRLFTLRYHQDIFDNFSHTTFLQYAATKRLQNEPLFTNAYIIPGKAKENKVETIHQRCLCFQRDIKSFEKAINDQSIKAIYNSLIKIPGIGSFLASQVCFDFLWSVNWKCELYELGTGAKRGAAKLDLSNKDNRYILETVMEYCHKSNMYPLIYKRRHIYPFIADIQNTLCEFDKWMRIVAPELDSIPKRIKNAYKPGKPSYDVYIPGFWVNESEKLVKLNLREFDE